MWNVQNAQRAKAYIETVCIASIIKQCIKTGHITKFVICPVFCRIVWYFVQFLMYDYRCLWTKNMQITKCNVIVCQGRVLSWTLCLKKIFLWFMIMLIIMDSWGWMVQRTRSPFYHWLFTIMNFVHVYCNALVNPWKNIKIFIWKFWCRVPFLKVPLAR